MCKGQSSVQQRKFEDETEEEGPKRRHDQLKIRVINKQLPHDGIPVATRNAGYHQEQDLYEIGEIADFSSHVFYEDGDVQTLHANPFNTLCSQKRDPRGLGERSFQPIAPDARDAHFSAIDATQTNDETKENTHCESINQSCDLDESEVGQDGIKSSQVPEFSIPIKSCMSALKEKPQETPSKSFIRTDIVRRTQIEKLLGGPIQSQNCPQALLIRGRNLCLKRRENKTDPYSSSYHFETLEYLKKCSKSHKNATGNCDFARVTPDYTMKSYDISRRITQKSKQNARRNYESVIDDYDASSQHNKPKHLSLNLMAIIAENQRSSVLRRSNKKFRNSKKISIYKPRHKSARRTPVRKRIQPSQIPRNISESFDYTVPKNSEEMIQKCKRLESFIERLDNNKLLYKQQEIMKQKIHNLQAALKSLEKENLDLKNTFNQVCFTKLGIHTSEIGLTL
ncbi:unnamed protein product [Moneuplotes crassus]|uniref:Uncharacterized protein n=1 Tax=Euplotes crassus TaxID=5936 RepID=A0AAD1XZR9_EUPCR|nr:unnamed protein product [Moneuplotes crassus]